MDYIPDYNDLLDRYEAEREREIEKLPICCECDNPIQTEDCYEFDGDLICPGCLNDYHRKSVDDYVT